VGSRCGVPKTAGTCREILKRREALWTFVQVEGVAPTNNTAERSIRPGVQWRKGSFGTQSEDGSRFVESMMTVVATLKQQQRNVLEYLTAAHEAALRGEAAPSLIPARTMESQAAAWFWFSLAERILGLTWSEVAFIEIQKANPGIDLQKPDWHRCEFAWTTFEHIRVEARNGRRRKRRFCKSRKQWKSFAHIPGGKKLT
jgi:Transposase IS66 family